MKVRELIEKLKDKNSTLSDRVRIETDIGFYDIEELYYVGRTMYIRTTSD